MASNKSKMNVNVNKSKKYSNDNKLSSDNVAVNNTKKASPNCVNVPKEKKQEIVVKQENVNLTGSVWDNLKDNTKVTSAGNKTQNGLVIIRNANRPSAPINDSAVNNFNRNGQSEGRFNSQRNDDSRNNNVNNFKRNTPRNDNINNFKRNSPRNDDVNNFKRKQQQDDSVNNFKKNDATKQDNDKKIIQQVDNSKINFPTIDSKATTQMTVPKKQSPKNNISNTVSTGSVWDNLKNNTNVTSANVTADIEKHVQEIKPLNATLSYSEFCKTNGLLDADYEQLDDETNDNHKTRITPQLFVTNFQNKQKHVCREIDCGDFAVDINDHLSDTYKEPKNTVEGTTEDTSDNSSENSTDDKLFKKSRRYLYH